MFFLNVECSVVVIFDYQTAMVSCLLDAPSKVCFSLNIYYPLIPYSHMSIA